MSNEQEALLMVGVSIYLVGVLAWNIFKWIDYGITEKNLLRCVLHSVWSPAWPIALMVYAFQALKKYAETRLDRDFAELFPAKKLEPRKVPIPVPVSSLGEDGPRYKPGDWVN